LDGHPWFNEKGNAFGVDLTFAVLNEGVNKYFTTFMTLDVRAN
jgi:hypothetical protein